MKDIYKDSTIHFLTNAEHMMAGIEKKEDIRFNYNTAQAIVMTSVMTK